MKELLKMRIKLYLEFIISFTEEANVPLIFKEGRDLLCVKRKE